MLAPALQIHSFLSSVPLFREFDADGIGRLAAHTRMLRLQRGEVLFHCGESPRGLYLVVHGQVKLVFRSPRGDEKVVEVFGAGQSFGEELVFEPRPYPVAALALDEALVLCIGAQALLPRLATDPLLAARIIGRLCCRIHALMKDLEACSMWSSRQRVVGYLLADCGPDASGPHALRLPTAKGIVASRLSITQEHFSRILHDLSAQGLIEVQARLIRILDVPRLRALLD